MRREQLHRSVVRILDLDDITVGAGFVLSSNGLLATCAHVIVDAGAGPGDTVSVAFEGTVSDTGSLPALVLPEFWRDVAGRDIAILQLDSALPAGVEVAPLGPSSGTAQHRAFSVGFPRVTRSPSPGEQSARPRSLAAESVVVATLLRRPAPEASNESHPILQLRSSEVTAGFSGGPLLDEQRQRVIGMVDSMLAPDDVGKLRDVAFATPVETLREICPALELSSICPFQGLAAFTEAQAAYFAGRRQVTERLLDSLRKDPARLLVLGPSGSGKSSVVHAGLVPALRRGALSGSDQWTYVVSRPADAPLIQLQRAGLVGAQAGLTTAVSSWAQQSPEPKRLVLVLDQFEELLVSCTRETRRRFVEDLECVLRRVMRVSLVLAMRSDFYGRFAEEAPALLELLEDGARNVMQILRREEIQAIVCEPTIAVGLTVEDALVSAIQEDVRLASPHLQLGEEHAGSTVLPLLQFALTEVWRRDHADGELTLPTYREIGRLSGALVQWAEGAFGELKTAGRDSTARRVLTALVHLGNNTEGIPDSRRRRTRTDLLRECGEPKDVDFVIGVFSRARLLAADGEGGSATIELIHDALIQEWGRLRNWLREDREFLAWRQETEPRLAAWLESAPSNVKERDKDLLLRGRELAVAQGWLAPANRSGLNVGELDFITTSANRQRSLRLLSITAAATLVGVLLIAVLYVSSQKRAAVASRQELAESSAVNWFRVGDTAFEYDHSTLLAFLSAAQALSVAPEDDPNRATYLARLLALAPSTPRMVMNLGPVARAAIDPDHSLVVLQRNEGYLEAWNTQSSQRRASPIEQLEIHGGLWFSDAPEIREDGRYAAIVTPTLEAVGDLRLIVWELSSGKTVISEATGLIFSPHFGPQGWVSHKERNGFRVWNIETSPASPREIPNALSLAPSTAALPLVALNDGGLRFLDLADSSVSAGPFLQGETIAWNGWTKDGKLLVVTRRGQEFRGHWCSLAGCADSSAQLLSADPGSTGLTIDPCGEIFGAHFLLRQDGKESQLPPVDGISRLCSAGEKLVALPETSSGQWRTLTRIVNFGADWSALPVDLSERKIPGGAIAAEWTADHEELTTLSASGMMLSWPAVVHSPTMELLHLSPNPKRMMGTWPEFDWKGELIAAADSDSKGIDVRIYSVSARRLVSSSRVDFETKGVPPQLVHDPHAILGQLRAVKFGPDAKELLIGVQSGKGSQLVIIDSQTGTVIDTREVGEGSMEDAALGDDSMNVVLDNRTAEQIPFRGANREVKRCELPKNYEVSGFSGKGALVLLQRSDGVEVWSLKTCQAIGRVQATAQDSGMFSLVNILLRQADEVRGDTGKLVARIGETEVVIQADSGALSVYRGATLLHLPTSSTTGGGYTPIAISPDLRRVAITHKSSPSGEAVVEVFDLDIGLSIGWPVPPSVVGTQWSTSESTHSVWGAGFSAGGEQLIILEPDQILTAYVGPPQVTLADWMKDVDVGVTGLRTKEDGTVYSPADALDQVKSFKRRLESASRAGDRAAQALLLVLNEESTTR